MTPGKLLLAALASGLVFAGLLDRRSPAVSADETQHPGSFHAPAVAEQQPVDAAPETASSLQAERREPKTSVQPLSWLEQSRLRAWARERGYPDHEVHADGQMTELATDYTAMSDEVLHSLAAQHDRRAHQLLAQRRLAATPAGEMPPAEAAQVAEHLRQASIGGYTATLADLSNFYSDRIFASGKRDAAALVDAWAYALVGVTRGDSYSERLLWLLETHPPVAASEEVKVQARTRTLQLLRELDAARQARGLPPFENGMPPEIRQLQRRAEIDALR